MLARRGMTNFDLEEIQTNESMVSAFDVDHIGTEALLWQTGYLTVVGAEEDEDYEVFRLGYPTRRCAGA